MNKTASTLPAAWGLELGATRAILVFLEEQIDGHMLVRERQVFELPPDWQSGQIGTALTAALTRVVPGEPLGICFPDQAMLCRGLSLPRAEPALMDKMIAAQAEGFLAGGNAGLEWTSSHSSDPSDPAKLWVLFCAARRDLLDGIRRALPSGVELTVLLPRALATASGCETDGVAASPRVLVDLTDQAMTLSLVVGRRVLRCLVLEAETEAGSAPADGADWVLQSRRGLEALIEGLPASARPRTGVLRGGNGDGTHLAAALSGALHLTIAPAVGLAAPAGTADGAGACEAAIGVAQLALRDADAAPINFARARPNAKAAAAPRPLRPRRLLALAVVALAALAALYFLDRYRENLLAAEVDRIRVVEKASGGVSQRLAVGKYLEKNACSALPVLDAVFTAAPPSLAITSFKLTSAGGEGGAGNVGTSGGGGLSGGGGGGMQKRDQLRLVVALGSPAEVTSFADKLEKSKVLAHIQLGSLRNNQGKWVLELSADVAGSAAAPAATTRPATAPAGVGHADPSPAPPPAEAGLPSPRATTRRGAGE